MPFNNAGDAALAEQVDVAAHPGDNRSAYQRLAIKAAPAATGAAKLVPVETMYGAGTGSPLQNGEFETLDRMEVTFEAGAIKSGLNQF